MLDALFCLTDPGDEVILADPTYAGMLNRVRLVGAVPRLVPLHVTAASWLDSPLAILRQNRCWISRRLTGGRPGDRIPGRRARLAGRDPRFATTPLPHGEGVATTA